MLKMSTRNSPLTLATENSFAIVASRFTYAGPSSTPLRSEFPNVFAAGDENTDVSEPERARADRAQHGRCAVDVRGAACCPAH